MPSSPSRVVLRYHNMPTEAKVDARFMRAYLSALPSRVFWIRAGSPGADLETFTRVMKESNSTLPFDLITSDGDAPASDLARRSGVLKLPNLRVWLAQNCDVNNNRVQPIPIGLDLHTPSIIRNRGLKGAVFNPQALVGRLGAFRKPAGHKSRKMLVLYDCGSDTHPERALAKRVLQTDSRVFMLPHRLPLFELWQTYADFAFGVSVQGKGLDCHRTWEMIYAGMIPIMRHSSIDALFEGLPVVFVESWAQVQSLDLQKELIKALSRQKKGFLLEAFDPETWYRKYGLLP